MPAIKLLDVAVYHENNPVAGQSVRGKTIRDLLCIPAEGAEWKGGRYGMTLKVMLEPSAVAVGLSRGPWVLKAAVPEDPDDAGAARECLGWEKEALAGQNRTPFLPTLAARGSLLAGERYGVVPFLLMSPVEGRTLREVLEEDPASLAPEPPEGGPLAEEAREALRRMKSERRLPVVTAVRRVALPLAEGLARLEERRFCHGDVSPSNVVLGEDGTVRMVDLGCLGSLGEEPRGKGTAPYVLPGWDDAPGGRPGDCRGVDAYALAVLLRKMTGPADDLVPPAAECAGALEEAAALEGEGAALFAPISSGGEGDVPVAFLAVATEWDRRFRAGLDRFIAMLEERYPAREGDGGTGGDGPFEEDSGPSEYFRRVLLAYAGWWESDVWSILRQTAVAGVPAPTFHRYFDVVAGARSFSAPRTLLAVVEAIFRQGGAKWLERSPWDAGRSDAARLRRSDVLCDQATALFLKDPDGNRPRALELLSNAAGEAGEEGRSEFKAHLLALAARVGLPLAEQSEESALSCARYALMVLREKGADGCAQETAWCVLADSAQLLLKAHCNPSLVADLFEEAMGCGLFNPDFAVGGDAQKTNRAYFALCACIAYRLIGSDEWKPCMALLNSKVSYYMYCASEYFENDDFDFSNALLEKAVVFGDELSASELARRKKFTSPDLYETLVKSFQDSVDDRMPAVDESPSDATKIYDDIADAEWRGHDSRSARIAALKEAQLIILEMGGIVSDRTESLVEILEHQIDAIKADNDKSVGNSMENGYYRQRCYPKDDTEAAVRKWEQTTDGSIDSLKKLIRDLFLMGHEGRERALPVLERLVELGDTSWIGRLHFTYRKVNPQRAAALLELGAKCGDLSCIKHLAESVRGADSEKYCGLLEQAARKDDCESLYLLARYLKDINSDRSIELLKRIIEINDANNGVRLFDQKYAILAPRMLSEMVSNDRLAARYEAYADDLEGYYDWNDWHLVDRSKCPTIRSYVPDFQVKQDVLWDLHGSIAIEGNEN